MLGLFTLKLIDKYLVYVLACYQVGGTESCPFSWAPSLNESRCGDFSAALVAIKVSF